MKKSYRSLTTRKEIIDYLSEYNATIPSRILADDTKLFYFAMGYHSIFGKSSSVIIKAPPLPSKLSDRYIKWGWGQAKKDYNISKIDSSYNKPFDWSEKGLDYYFDKRISHPYFGLSEDEQP